MAIFRVFWYGSVIIYHLPGIREIHHWCCYYTIPYKTESKAKVLKLLVWCKMNERLTPQAFQVLTSNTKTLNLLYVTFQNIFLKVMNKYFFVYIKWQINALWELAYLKSSHLILQLSVRINFIAGIEAGAVDVWINETRLRSSKIFEFSVRERPINTKCQYHRPSAHIEEHRVLGENKGGATCSSRADR